MPLKQLLEKTLFIELPGEYKTFLQAFGGGYFAFVIVFSATKGSEWNLVAQNEQAGVLEKYSFLAISDNEAGDYYGFKVEDGVCDSKISFFDHEDGSVKETKYENLFEYLIKEGLTIK